MCLLQAILCRKIGIKVIWYSLFETTFRVKIRHQYSEFVEGKIGQERNQALMFCLYCEYVKLMVFTMNTVFYLNGITLRQVNEHEQYLPKYNPSHCIPDITENEVKTPSILQGLIFFSFFWQIW